MDWNALTQRYARECQISWYAAKADVEARRQSNGDDEAGIWFTRVLAGERLAWNDKAV